MISRLNHVNVFVLDQDRAKAFYTETLGFELRNDAVLDGFRWLTVGPKDQKDLDILLAYPAPPMFSPEDAEAVRALVAKGSLGGGCSRPPTATRPSRSCRRRASRSSRNQPNGRTGSKRSSATTPGTGSASPSPSGSASQLDCVLSRRPVGAPSR
jgi:catechol 2,3-dioxygenase-like lactoylglutathione lyase family enzyme